MHWLVKTIGSVRMQIAATNALSFLTKLTSLQISNVHHATLYRELGGKIVSLADHALELRQTENVRLLSEILSNMPGSYGHIGQYYRAMCLKRTGQVAQARTLLEQCAQDQQTPLSYRSRALHAIGATYYEADTSDEALRYYLDAARAGFLASDLFSLTQSQWMVAVLKSVDGDHKNALQNLQALFPQVRLIAGSHPAYFYIYQNALAVELAEVGQIQAAQHASRIALASPFVHAYPEWQQTGTDLSIPARSRSVIQIAGFRLDSRNVLALPPLSQRVVQSSPLRPGEQTGKLLDYVRLKKKMVKEKNSEPDENVDELERSDLIVRLLELTSKDDVDDEKLRKILKYTMKVVTGK